MLTDPKISMRQDLSKIASQISQIQQEETEKLMAQLRKEQIVFTPLP